MKRILFLTSFPYGDLTSGQGLILTQTIRGAERLQAAATSYATFRVHARSVHVLDQAQANPARRPKFSVAAPQLGRREMLLSALGWGGSGLEELAGALWKAHESYDCVVWMGLPMDPAATRIPRLTNLPCFCYMVDSPGLHAARRAEGVLGKARFLLARRRERAILAAGYRGVIYVTHEDVEFASSLLPCMGAPALKVIPIGVDTNEWHPSADRPEGRDGLVVVFSGVMYYKPNVAAARYLVEAILPLINRPNLSVRIVGKDPLPEVSALAERDRRVTITGTVPDVLAELHAADVFVAPMRNSAGIKIKLLQAMAVGLPVVATPECATAFSSPPPGMLVGKTPAQLAASIEDLADRPKERAELGRAGREFVLNGWSWTSRTQTLLEFLARNGTPA